MDGVFLGSAEVCFDGGCSVHTSDPKGEESIEKATKTTLTGVTRSTDFSEGVTAASFGEKTSGEGLKRIAGPHSPLEI